MRYVWIVEGQIAGNSDVLVEPKDCPSGFLCVEAPDLPNEALYWDGEAVVEKPPRPSEAHYWDSEQNAWIAPAGSEPPTLEAAITQAQQRCLDYWAGRIAGLTAGYPDTEVATWLDFKQEADQFIASQDLDDAPNLYHEIMLRQFGPIATAEYCEMFHSDYPDEALQLVNAFAQGILEKNGYLLPELTRLKGLRGYHWEQIGKLESVKAVQDYDFSVES